MKSWFRVALVLSVVSALFAACGCGVDFAYLIPVSVGQIDLLIHSVPIEQAIADGSVQGEELAKLTLIDDVRSYGRDVMKLDVTDNYTLFYDSGGEPVAFNLSASRKDAFEPAIWTFPIVGTVPYLGYFDEDAAKAKAQTLVDQGYDVFVYEVDAYSTVGFLPNPVLSPMLQRSEYDLVETVLHELLHSTIWRENDTTFNESLATFYGRTGALSYYAARYPDEPQRLVEVRQGFEDADTYNEFAMSLYEDLDTLYSSDLSSEEKIAARDAVYEAGRQRFFDVYAPRMNDPDQYSWVTELPANNAWLLGVRRYNLNLDVFAQAFEATGEDWATAIDLFRQAAQATDPYAFLRTQTGSARLRTAVPAAPQTASAPADSASRGPCDLRLSTTIH